jgi:ABC-type transporter Mla subunit MlaD
VSSANGLAKEMRVKLDSLAAGTDSFAAAMQEVAASSEEQSASTEQIAAAAGTLSVAADRLSRVVANLRLEDPGTSAEQPTAEPVRSPREAAYGRPVATRPASVHGA